MLVSHCGAGALTVSMVVALVPCSSVSRGGDHRAAIVWAHDGEPLQEDTESTNITRSVS